MGGEGGSRGGMPGGPLTLCMALGSPGGVGDFGFFSMFFVFWVHAILSHHVFWNVIFCSFGSFGAVWEGFWERFKTVFDGVGFVNFSYCREK